MILSVVHISSALQGAPGAPAPWMVAVFFAALTAFGMLVGVWTVRRFEGWAVHHTAELIAFAAGLLVSGALLHLIAHSVELIGAAAGLAWTLLSFVAFYLLEAHFVPHVHERGESPIEDHTRERPLRRAPERLGALVILGLGVHSVADGISVGAGLSASALLGSVSALLVLVHKLPEGIAAMSALYHAGVAARRAGWITAGLASVTPLAVLVSFFILRGVSANALGILLALSGGSFLYVGAADLLPEGQAHGRPANTGAFLLGGGVMAVVKLVA